MPTPRAMKRARRRTRPTLPHAEPSLGRTRLPRVSDLLDDLVEWLRIPSISTGGGDPADLRRAAEWAAERVERAGGSAEPGQIGDGHPLAIGDLRATTADAPTILIYGHYDVQSVGDPGAWTS